MREKCPVPDPRESTEPGPRFLGYPDRWLADPHYRCGYGHVSRMILKSEERGDLCLACQDNVRLTFPEDVDDEDAYVPGESGKADAGPG